MLVFTISVKIKNLKIDPLFPISLFTINSTAVYLRNVNNTLCEPQNIYFSFLPETAVNQKTVEWVDNITVILKNI